MECRDVRKLADAFVSDELGSQANLAVLGHLAACPSCSADVAAAAGMRAALRRAFLHAPELRVRHGLAADLRARLKTIPAAAPRRVAWARWASIAALLCLVAGAAGLWTRLWSTVDALTKAAVGDHRDCALTFRLPERPIALEEAARRYEPSYRLLETVPPDDLTPLLGSGLILERHSCVYDGRRFAHLVLHYRGTRVSILVASVERTPASDDSLDARWRLQRIDGYGVAARRAGAHAVYVVGLLDDADINRIAERLGTVIAERLIGA